MAASTPDAAPSRAAVARGGDVREKHEKKQKKRRSCKDEEDLASPAGAAGGRTDSSESFRVSSGKKSIKLGRRDPDDEHRSDAANATAKAAATAAAGGGEVATERETKRRRKREEEAVAEACGTSSEASSGSSGGRRSNCSISKEEISRHKGRVSSNTSNGSSSSSNREQIGKHKVSKRHSMFISNSVNSVESDSSTTCCSSPSAASDRDGTSLEAATAKKNRNKVTEDAKVNPRDLHTTRVVKKDTEKILVAETATAPAAPATPTSAATAPRAAAAEKEDLQGSQLSAYKLTAQTLNALQQRGIRQLLPIQEATFAAVYAGKDLIGRADTGTGKTLAFALPLVERLLSPAVSSNRPSSSDSISERGVRLLVLLPTRELAQQVHGEFVLLLQDRLQTACVYGGTSGTTAAGRQQHQHSWQTNSQKQLGGGNLVQQQQQKQLEDLRRGRCSIVVGCPGRVKDVINRGLLQRGAALQSVVLDEADRLLDMGFREDVEEILQWCRDAWDEAHMSFAAKRGEVEEDEKEEAMKKKSAAAGDVQESPAHRSRSSTNDALQFLLFTATLPHWARSIASRFMRPDRLLVDAAALARNNNKRSGSATSTSSSSGEEEAADALSSEQRQQSGSSSRQGITYLVLFCPWKNRVRVLENVLMIYSGSAPAIASSAPSGVSPAIGCCVATDAAAASAAGERGTGAAAVIFADTKQQVNEIALESGLRRLAAPLHGDLPQQQRETTLHAFKSGCFPYLVATDVAARGLHVENLPLVVQLSPPRDLDSFVHRAGRTGRAGRAGVCLTFAATPDIPTLLALEKKLRMQFKRVGVPQPAGIQRHLLDLQLRHILPAAAHDTQRNNSDGGSSSSEGSSSNIRKRRKGLATLGEEGDAEVEDETDSEKETDEEEAEQKERHGAEADGGGPAGGKQCVVKFGKGRDGKRTEEEKQISDAAKRVLQALPPHEAVRRCLTLLLRHAAAGTAAAAGAPNTGSAASSSPSSACETEAQTTALGGDRLSCLNGREGFRTYILVLRKPKLQAQQQDGDGDLLRTPGQVWRLLKGALLYQPRAGSSKRAFSERAPAADRVEDLLERIHSLTLTANGTGAVFDVATADVPAFAAHVLSRCSSDHDQPPKESCERGPADQKRNTTAGRKNAAVVGRDVMGVDRGRAGANTVPFIIREAEELPDLVDALALRRSEQQQQRGSRGSTQQEGSCSRVSWHGGRDSSRGREGGRSHSSGCSRTGGEGRNSSFRSVGGGSRRSASLNLGNSERWKHQRNTSCASNSCSRGGSSSSGERGRGGGGGRGGEGSSSSRSGFSGAHRGRGGLGSGSGRISR